MRLVLPWRLWQNWLCTTNCSEHWDCINIDLGLGAVFALVWVHGTPFWSLVLSQTSDTFECRNSDGSTYPLLRPVHYGYVDYEIRSDNALVHAIDNAVQNQRENNGCTTCTANFQEKTQLRIFRSLRSKVFRREDVKDGEIGEASPCWAWDHPKVSNTPRTTPESNTDVFRVQTSEWGVHQH